MPNIPETVLELDLNALEHNHNHLRSRIRPDTKFMAVVKAFAYGSDAVLVARKLESLSVDYFAVAYVKEGITLRQAGIKTRILVLHPQVSNFKDLLEHDLEPSLYSPRVLRAFLQVCEEMGQKKVPVHLKFNTGLNRLGFWENDVGFILSELKERQEVEIVSVFSHLAATEDPNEREFTVRQIQTFKKIAAALGNRVGKVVMQAYSQYLGYHQLS